MHLPIRVHPHLDGVLWWEAYSEEHRVELGACAVQHGSNFLVFDPIGSPEEILCQVNQISSSNAEPRLALKPTAIVLTNGNHERASEPWSETFRIPVYASDRCGLRAEQFRPLQPGPSPFEGWHCTHLEGGGPGELAFFLKAKSLAIFGDAIVHLPSRGLELLPAKYCTNAPQLRASIAQFVQEVSFEHALMAHGKPLLTDAREKITALLNRMTG